MDSLKWCFEQNKGIRIIEPNEDVARKYLADAKRDFTLVNRDEPKWNIIKEYYVCYNAFYALLMKCGIKCEIHDCTLKLMNLFGFDETMQNKLIDIKRERINVQYYLGESKKDYFDFASDFLEMCEVRFLELNDFEIKRIRLEVKEDE